MCTTQKIDPVCGDKTLSPQMCSTPTTDHVRAWDIVALMSERLQLLLVAMDISIMTYPSLYVVLVRRDEHDDGKVQRVQLS